jgi:hypothetical protein
MFSQAYYELVEKSKIFHLENKTWGGLHMIPYGPFIKELAVKHNINSLLDYGCGKGKQYSDKHEWEPGVVAPFDQYIGIDDVYKYDPCWKEFETPPPADKKFDAIILIQCIGFYPDDDIPILKEMLMRHTAKFCFIGEVYSSYGKIKPKKQKNLDPQYFRAARSPEWFAEQFKDWTGSELVFKYF